MVRLRSAAFGVSAVCAAGTAAAGRPVAGVGNSTFGAWQEPIVLDSEPHAHAPSA